MRIGLRKLSASVSKSPYEGRIARIRIRTLNYPTSATYCDDDAGTAAGLLFFAQESILNSRAACLLGI